MPIIITSNELAYILTAEAGRKPELNNTFRAFQNRIHFVYLDTEYMDTDEFPFTPEDMAAVLYDLLMHYKGLRIDDDGRRNRQENLI